MCLCSLVTVLKMTGCIFGGALRHICDMCRPQSGRIGLDEQKLNFYVQNGLCLIHSVIFRVLACFIFR